MLEQEKRTHLRHKSESCSSDDENNTGKTARQSEEECFSASEGGRTFRGGGGWSLAVDELRLSWSVTRRRDADTDGARVLIPRRRFFFAGQLR